MSKLCPIHFTTRSKMSSEIAIVAAAYLGPQGLFHVVVVVVVTQSADEAYAAAGPGPRSRAGGLGLGGEAERPSQHAVVAESQAALGHPRQQKDRQQ